MKISILTLFPEMFACPFHSSIVKRAQERKIVTVDLVNIRNFATDKYKSVDDHPYGGGAGMILRVDVVDRTLQSVIPAKAGIQSYDKLDPRIKLASLELRRSGSEDDKIRTVLLDPQGIPYSQAKAQELSHLEHLILLCGHYEGVDERIRTLVDEEISIGDYITTGGEIPAMVVVDSVTRLLSGVLKKPQATQLESFSSNEPLLEYPQYTRPETYKRMTVPPILLSGNHAAITGWRERQAQKRTKIRRPDLALTKKRGRA